MPRSRFQKITQNLPGFISSYLEIIYGYQPLLFKYTKKYYSTKRVIKRTEFWPPKKLQSFQVCMLNRITQYVWDNVPGYKEFWGDHHFHPAKINSLEDIKRIPCITKEILKRDTLKFTNLKLKGRIFDASTGGSTGVPLRFYLQKENNGVEWAFMSDQWLRVGYKQGDRVVRIKGDIVNNNDYVKYDPISRCLIVSSYHLTEKYLPLIISKIREYNPDIVHAYPSSAYAIAQYLRNHNAYLNVSLKGVMMGSEMLYEEQKYLISERFSARCYSWYGLSEKCVLAGYCEKNDYFHIYPQYGVCEVLKSNGDWAEEGETGEIVGTSFWMKATPFIRYKTGDLAIKGPSTCEECGRKYQLLLSIEGRGQEYLIDKSGQKVVCTGIYYLGNVDDRIDDIQLSQYLPGEVDIHVLSSGSQGQREEIEKKIIKDFERRYGNNFRLSVTLVNKISKSKTGKKIYLKQNIRN